MAQARKEFDEARCITRYNEGKGFSSKTDGISMVAFPDEEQEPRLYPGPHYVTIFLSTTKNDKKVSG